LINFDQFCTQSGSPQKLLNSATCSCYLP